MAMDRTIPRLVLVLLVGASLTITLTGVRSIQDIIAPTVFALVLTITIHPMRAWLNRRNLPDWTASLIMLLVAYLLIIAVCLMSVISLGRLAALLPQYATQISNNLEEIGGWLQARGVGEQQVEAIIDAFDVGGLVSFATGLLGDVLSAISVVVFIAALLLFMAFDTTSTTRVLDGLSAAKPDLVRALRHFALGTRSYMVASATFGLIVAIIDTVALWIMGVPGALVWGVLAFVTNFIPNVGFVIGVVPPALIALLEGGPGLMVGVVVVYSAINFVIQSVIQPRVVGDKVGLSPTITILSLVFWTWAVGPLGAILAVPLSLLLKALLIEADPDARWALPLISGKVEDKPAQGPATLLTEDGVGQRQSVPADLPQQP
jgi:AI-2 transport protein TqsA